MAREILLVKILKELLQHSGEDDDMILTSKRILKDGNFI